jgi:hypothetical protein
LENRQFVTVIRLSWWGILGGQQKAKTSKTVRQAKKQKQSIPFLYYAVIGRRRTQEDAAEWLFGAA